MYEYYRIPAVEILKCGSHMDEIDGRGKRLNARYPRHHDPHECIIDAFNRASFMSSKRGYAEKRKERRYPTLGPNGFLMQCHQHNFRWAVQSNNKKSDHLARYSS